MSPVFAATGLVRMFYTSLLAVLAIACIFSLAILGAIRSSDLRREGRGQAAAWFAALAAVGLAGSAGIVIYGLFLVAHKG